MNNKLTLSGFYSVSFILYNIYTVVCTDKAGMGVLLHSCYRVMIIMLFVCADSE